MVPFPAAAKYFFLLRQCPHWLWGPPSLVINVEWGDISHGLKRPGHEAYDLLPSSTEVKNERVELYLHFPTLPKCHVRGELPYCSYVNNYKHGEDTNLLDYVRQI